MLKMLCTTSVIAVLASVPAASYAQSADTETDAATTEQTQGETATDSGSESGGATLTTEDEAGATAESTDDAGGDAAPVEAEEMDSGDTAADTKATDDGAAATEEAPADEGAAATEEAPAEEATGDAGAAAADVEGQPVEGQIVMQSEDTVLAETLIGARVYSGEETIGDINDLIVKLDGTVEGVVIGVGGFLGIGQKDVALKFDRISVQTDENGNPRLTVDTSKEELENAPEFKTVSEQRSEKVDQQMQDSGTGGMGGDAGMGDAGAGTGGAATGGEAQAGGGDAGTK